MKNLEERLEIKFAFDLLQVMVIVGFGRWEEWEMKS